MIMNDDIEYANFDIKDLPGKYIPRSLGDYYSYFPVMKNIEFFPVRTWFGYIKNKKPFNDLKTSGLYDNKIICSYDNSNDKTLYTIFFENMLFIFNLHIFTYDSLTFYVKFGYRTKLDYIKKSKFIYDNCYNIFYTRGIEYSDLIFNQRDLNYIANVLKEVCSILNINTLHFNNSSNEISDVLCFILTHPKYKEYSGLSIGRLKGVKTIEHEKISRTYYKRTSKTRR
jgi:hypothetical protein